MKRRVEKAFIVLSPILLALLGYILHLQRTPAQIMAVHNRGPFSHVLAQHFPTTDKGKIAWWLRNKSMLRKQYAIPSPNQDGTFFIMIWDFGDGYKEQQGDDRLCFDDMTTKFRCIEKDRLLFINSSRNRGLIVEIGNRDYRVGENGIVTKLGER